MNQMKENQKDASHSSQGRTTAQEAGASAVDVWPCDAQVPALEGQCRGQAPHAHGGYQHRSVPISILNLLLK